MKLFGVNELAVRLPSAIAAFFTCMALLIFSLRYLRDFWFGFIAIFVLVTSQGYINLHATRTGDYDALLTLFTTLSGLMFFSYCEKKDYKRLYLFFLFTALAVLTKGIAGLLFLPGIFLYSIMQKQLTSLLKIKHFYIGLLVFLIIVVGYYLLRESYNPGYMEAVQKNELGGRYVEVIENHQQDFWFYYYNFIGFQLSAWHLLVPCGLVIGFAVKDQKIRRITLFSSIMVTTYFLVISSAQTKLEWYDVPMYPYLCIIITVFILYVFYFLQNFKGIHRTLTVNVTPYVFLFLIGIIPYRDIIYKTYRPRESRRDKDFYEISYFLKDAVEGKYNLNKHFLLYEKYNPQNLFYIKMLNDCGIQISWKDWRNLSPNDTAIAYQPRIKQYIKEHYKYEVIQIEGKIVIYSIRK